MDWGGRRERREENKDHVIESKKIKMGKKEEKLKKTNKKCEGNITLFFCSSRWKYKRKQ